MQPIHAGLGPQVHTPDIHNAHVLAWFKHLGAADVLNGVLDNAGIESSGCLASATCTQDGVLHRTSSASSAMLAACTCTRWQPQSGVDHSPS